MATTTGRKTDPLGRSGEGPLARLVASPKNVTLGQALRLLGMEHSGDYEAWLRFMQRRVRVRAWLSLAFPVTELTEYRSISEESPSASTGESPNASTGESTVELTATGFGLYGTLGPLPTFYTEELLEEARHSESVSRDFLDMLNARLHHCLHLTTLWGKLPRRTIELQDPQAVHVLHCLMGRAYPSLRPSGAPRVAVLELLLRHTRSAMGLESYCAYALGFAGTARSVRVEQCVPRTARIPASQRCCLGQANSSLGTDITLGEEVRDHTGKFRIHFEGLNMKDMERFLPAGSDFTTVDVHVRQFVDVPLEYDIVLHPAQETGFRQRLGARLGGYLLPGDIPPEQTVTVYHSG